MGRKSKMERNYKTLFRRKSPETSGILQTRLHDRQIDVREIMGSTQQPGFRGRFRRINRKSSGTGS